MQPFTNLIGCPLNGTWTFTSTDLYAIDNGFICDWSINFDPAIIPDATQFTPVLGITIDSAGWTGPSFLEDPNDPLIGQATLVVPGSYDYTFTVMDNFGCSYDTTINVTIDPQMVVDAGPPIVLCNVPEPMAGGVTANAVPNITYVWVPATGLTDPSDPLTDVFVTSPTWFFLTAYPAGSPECAVMDSVLVTPPPSLDPGEDAAITICPSSPIFVMTDSLGGTPQIGGTWTDVAGTVQADNFTPATATPGTYSYTYTVISPALCIATAQLDITVILTRTPPVAGCLTPGCRPIPAT
ncbi:MAG: hypothetical protein IPO60_05410 [Flavobacteriales bacterium]|nr:hypothetical protein [Flavobacteriales bacterium]